MNATNVEQQLISTLNKMPPPERKAFFKEHHIAYAGYRAYWFDKRPEYFLGKMKQQLTSRVVRTTNSIEAVLADVINKQLLASKSGQCFTSSGANQQNTSKFFNNIQGKSIQAEPPIVLKDPVSEGQNRKVQNVRISGLSLEETVRIINRPNKDDLNELNKQLLLDDVKNARKLPNKDDINALINNLDEQSVSAIAEKNDEERLTALNKQLLLNDVNLAKDLRNKVQLKLVKNVTPTEEQVKVIDDEQNEKTKEALNDLISNILTQEQVSKIANRPNALDRLNMLSLLNIVQSEPNKKDLNLLIIYTSTSQIQNLVDLTTDEERLTALNKQLLLDVVEGADNEENLTKLIEKLPEEEITRLAQITTDEERLTALNKQLLLDVVEGADNEENLTKLIEKLPEEEITRLAQITTDEERLTALNKQLLLNDVIESTLSDKHFKALNELITKLSKDDIAKIAGMKTTDDTNRINELNKQLLIQAIPSVNNNYKWLVELIQDHLKKNGINIYVRLLLSLGPDTMCTRLTDLADACYEIDGNVFKFRYNEDFQGILLIQKNAVGNGI